MSSFWRVFLFCFYHVTWSCRHMVLSGQPLAEVATGSKLSAVDEDAFEQLRGSVDTGNEKVEASMDEFAEREMVIASVLGITSARYLASVPRLGVRTVRRQNVGLEVTETGIPSGRFVVFHLGMVSEVFCSLDATFRPVHRVTWNDGGRYGQEIEDTLYPPDPAPTAYLPKGEVSPSRHAARFDVRSRGLTQASRPSFWRWTSTERR
eukprot:496648-Rhodomonas_salina.2